MFQDYARYGMTLIENITFSEKDISRKVSEIEETLEINLRSRIPEGMILGKEYGVRELSGGQWQQLALMRSYYKDVELLFLDEPTASIDPLQESTLHERFKNLC